MPYDRFIFLLSMLSLVTLLVLVSIWILDFTNASSKQKLIFLKTAFAIIALAPFCFIMMRMYFPNTLVLAFSEEFVNQKILPRSNHIMLHNQLTGSFYIIVLYLIGLTIMLSRILFSYLSAHKLLKGSIPGMIQGQLVFKCDHIQNPLCFGLFKSKIYIPKDAESRWSKREIQISIAHELHHLEQHDPFWKLLAYMVQAFLFFVPWIYYLNRKFDLEMEIFCDTKVCRTTAISIEEYGHVLLAMTCSQTQNLNFNNITDSTLKRRFLAMKKKTKNALILTSILSALLLTAGSSAIVMASGIAHTEDYFRITSKIMVDGKVVSNPVILARENQNALIIITNTNSKDAEGLKMKLTAHHLKKFTKDRLIEINYEIEYKNGHNEVRTNPTIIIAPDHEKKIILSSDSEHLYEMQVIAKKELSPF